MVDIAPFRALRYSVQKKSGNISEYICPPYDVISHEEREVLVHRSPQNVVQMELPEADAGGADQYKHAAELLDQWKDQGVLQSDRKAAFYLLETTFRIHDAFAPKSKLKRYGVLAALRLETPGKGAVHPHERTLPKAKEDRLHLLRAVKTNVSPIFGLFFDTKKEWGKWVKNVIKTKPLVQGSEKKDLEHQMWKIDTPTHVVQLRALLKLKDLYIADGHHRYEVSWAYKEQRLQENLSVDLSVGWRRVMAYICPMEEPGLLMLPTHRLIKTSKTWEEWKTHLESLFDFTPMKSIQSVVKALIEIKPPRRSMGWITQKGCTLLTLKEGTSIERYLQNRPDALRELDVVLLHDVVMGEGSQTPFLQEKEVIPTRDLKEIQTRTQTDPAWVAFLLASPGVGSLARVALANEVMPPKTTYFYPKVPTGFTLMPLDQTIL
jgi:uncharacterized protein (DUF1015 family)